MTLLPFLIMLAGTSSDPVDASESFIDRMTSDFAMSIYVIALAVIFILMVVVFLLNDYRKNKYASALHITDPKNMSGMKGGFGPGFGSGRMKARSSKNRFQLLSKLDEEHPTYTHIPTNEDLTLEKLCEDFRNFASKELGLYYSIQDIRNFISSLGVSKIPCLLNLLKNLSISTTFGWFSAELNKTSPILLFGAFVFSLSGRLVY